MSQEAPPLLAGLEAGGTKMVCAVAQTPEEILRETRIPTTQPEETLSAVAAFFREATQDFGPLASLGIGSFGPANVHARSPGFGEILTTPKEGWTGVNMIQRVQEQLAEPVPIAFDTDVNAAAIGEASFGAGRGHRYVCYVTVGTGIGGGFLMDGQPLHGRMHPEIGHMAMPNLDLEYGKDTNVCPFHLSCLEGRASGTALNTRWGQHGSELPEDHPAWELHARYLSLAAMNLTAAWSPDVILFGGGVFQQAGLIDRIRSTFEKDTGGYWSLPPLDVYLQTPELGQQAGIVGALVMAQRAVTPF
ncbi:MAG: ROK family protein [Verrucomicrobiota bacterium]